MYRNKIKLYRKNVASEFYNNNPIKKLNITQVNNYIHRTCVYIYIYIFICMLLKVKSKGHHLMQILDRTKS